MGVDFFLVGVLGGNFLKWQGFGKEFLGKMKKGLSLIWEMGLGEIEKRVCPSQGNSEDRRNAESRKSRKNAGRLV